MPKTTIPTFDNFIDVGGLWVRYDAIGTVKDVERSDGPHCQVVLTIPGYKTLGVGCTAAELLGVIEETRKSHEYEVGYDRAKGMLEFNSAGPKYRTD